MPARPKPIASTSTSSTRATLADSPLENYFLYARLVPLPAKMVQILLYTPYMDMHNKIGLIMYYILVCPTFRLS